ncbi:hypothetical protein B0J11DRAFT_491380 [Dendryphion nanum]|uniref:Peptide hydrolase n=1 Tax=Dendryphion nanum TaxID=256645 RepID=A0A9P9DLX3_9PLEO|nr:hypothetical protein B0J11DRAFT_491380 [Dendryphion nanum]
MRYAYYFAALAVASALPVDVEVNEKLYTIELAPGETKQVTEAEKWQLKAEGKDFFDITDWVEFNPTALNKRQAVAYPTTLTQGASVRALNARLSASTAQSNLQSFTEFNNRYYRATTGKQASDWLLAKVRSYVPANANGVTVNAFTHSFVQNSIIARIPGRGTKTIVVGAHLDSVNGNSPTSGRSPGADDNGSGSVTILEAFRTLLSNATIASGASPNTIEFHWYAGEEGGLLGSQAIFNSYSSSGRNIAAMLNQDMTGYTGAYKAAGLTPRFGIITDNVNAALTAFTKRVITAYSTVGFRDSRCGYACSDHASATRAGFPSALVFESEMDYDNPYIHTAQDTIEKVDFAHVIEHAKVVVGFVVELAFAVL